MAQVRMIKLVDWSVRAKLVALAATLIVFTAMTTGIALIQINRISTEVHHITERDVPARAVLVKVAMLQLQRDTAFVTAMAAAERMREEISAGIQFVKANEAFTQLGVRVAAEVDKASEAMRNLTVGADTDRIRRELDRIQGLVDNVRARQEAYSERAGAALDATSKGETGRAIGLVSEATQQQDLIDRKLAEALAHVDGVTRLSIGHLQRAESLAFWLLIAVAAAAVTVGIGLSIVFTRAITKPLGEAVDAVEALAEGDMDVRLESAKGGELGVLANAVLVLREKLQERDRMGERLMKSQKMDAIGQLTGGIAHDFNNLLMIVDGYTRRALTRSGEDETAKSSLREVLKATETAAKLTKQLLVFSRRQAMEKKVFLVAEALHDVEPLFRKSVSESIGLSVECEDESLSIHTDQGEFTQAILNLVNNARDALQEMGTITIRSERVNLDEAFVSEHEGLEPGAYVTISVADTGVGMTEEVKERLFEPFFTTKGQGQGTGLGMAMVLGFSQQCGGTVLVESAPGEGTTVHIVLPLAASEAIKAAAEVDEACTGNGEIVLVVEDEEALRILNSETLRELGYEILTAADGFEALEVEEDCEGEIDLLLSDVVMPNMGGFELCEIMREKQPDLKAIFVSGYPNRAEAEGTPMPDRTTFLQKPVSPNRLAQAVRQELDSRAA